MKIKSNFKGGKKEYPDLTFEQVKLLVDYMNQGKTEKEAMELVLNGTN